jgi:hypothetical protein
MRTQILIVGGGTGGVAAAIAACALGMNVILTEETDWLGGQLTAQAVPPDENPWIETQGCTQRYREFRNCVRQHYRDHFPLTSEAKSSPQLNPGGGFVSRLCFDPRVGVAVLDAMLAEFIASGRLTVLRNRKATGAHVDRDRIVSVELENLESGERETIEADYFLDATELGDLLPLSHSEYVVGDESRPGNVQAFTWCAALALDPTPGADHTINKPRQYDRWRDFHPVMTPPYGGRLFDWMYPIPWTLQQKQCQLFAIEEGVLPLFSYRQIVSRDRFDDPNVHDVTIVNWPQNDYFAGNIIDEPPEVVADALEESRQLTLSLVYWLQTEQGYPGLYLRPDITGTKDGLAKYPYIRESRRIRAMFTVTEDHLSTAARFGDNPTTNPTDFSRLAEPFKDSVGVGYYRIDLHPSTGGDNSIDIASLPFQIPLGALLPVRVTNLLTACKNIGTTHITNGCYRMHPVEWNIGESAGLLAAICLSQNLVPKRVWEDAKLLEEFQQLLASQGVQLSWV